MQGLKNTPHAVTARPIYLARSSFHNNYIESAEEVISAKYDILIQFVLPSFAIYHGNVKKRIGIFNTETIPQHIPLG